MAYTTATSSTAGCQVSLEEYVNLVRDQLEDWQYEDRLQSALTDSSTSVSVLDYSKFRVGDIVQIDTEQMQVSAASANPITVRRGWRRTDAAAHGASATILAHTRWTDAQFKNWINESFSKMYPAIYDSASTTLTGSSTDYTYDLPAAVTDISQIEKVEATFSGYADIWEVTGCKIRRTNPPTLYIPRWLDGYTLTVLYTKPFGTLADNNDRTTIPEDAKMLPVYYACARAMEQKEALRSRFDAFTPKQDIYSTREGQHLATGREYYKMFKDLLYEVKMPSRGFIGNT